jgi:hypothetical protein
MANQDFTSKIEKARVAGYSDEEIVNHMTTLDPKFKQAKEAGYSDKEILGHFETSMGKKVGDVAKTVASKVADTATSTVAGMAGTVAGLGDYASKKLTPFMYDKDKPQLSSEQVGEGVAKGISEPLKTDYQPETMAGQTAKKFLEKGGEVIGKITNATLGKLTNAVGDSLKAAGADKDAIYAAKQLTNIAATIIAPEAGAVTKAATKTAASVIKKGAVDAIDATGLGVRSLVKSNEQLTDIAKKLGPGSNAQVLEQTALEHSQKLSKMTPAEARKYVQSPEYSKSLVDAAEQLNIKPSDASRVASEIKSATGEKTSAQAAGESLLGKDHPMTQVLKNHGVSESMAELTTWITRLLGHGASLGKTLAADATVAGYKASSTAIKNAAVRDVPTVKPLALSQVVKSTKSQIPLRASGLRQTDVKDRREDEAN